MRPIDADKLKLWFPHDSDWEYPVSTNEYVSELIDEQPTLGEGCATCLRQGCRYRDGTVRVGCPLWRKSAV